MNQLFREIKIHQQKVLKYRTEVPKSIASYFRNWNPQKSGHMYLKTDLELVSRGLNFNWAKHLILHDVRWNIYEVEKTELSAPGDIDTLLVLRELEKLLVECGAEVPENNELTSPFAERPKFQIPITNPCTATEEFVRISSILIIILEARLKFINWILEKRKRVMLFLLTLVAVTHLFSDFSNLESLINIIH